mgnify:CR=1 FL=1
MKKYIVTIPIAGHTWVEIEAKNEDEAIEMATGSDDLNKNAEWKILTRFVKGNMCCCPSPGRIEVKEIEE